MIDIKANIKLIVPQILQNQICFMIQKKQFPTLQSLALDVVAKNYHIYPQLKGVPDRIKEKIIQRSIEETSRHQNSVIITAPNIQQEKYWKACCERQKKNYHTIKLEDHGLSWKIAYLEKYIERMIENTENYLGDSRNNIIANISVINPWIFTLQIKINSPDLSIQQICKYLSNLINLKVRCSQGKSTDYKKKIIGMRFAEARDISQVLRTTQSLLSLNLAGNLIDDDLFKFIMPGLTLNTTLVQLNLSYNKIGDQGARRISKYLIKNEILTSLNLSNNLIAYDGSRYIAQALKLNSCLQILNLKLNSIDDKAGAKLFKDLSFNNGLKSLDLEANSLGSMSIRKLCLFLQVPNTLRQINLGSNNFNEGQHQIILDALNDQKSKQHFRKSKFSQIRL